MIVSHVVAVGQNGVIGYNNRIPWHIPDELRHFKKVTMGKALILGRKTFCSIGKPLEGRRVIVVSGTMEKQNGIDVVRSVEAALDLCRNDKEVIIGGGGMLYAATMPLVDRIYLSMVRASPAGDVYYPHLDQSYYREVLRKEYSDAYVILCLDRLTTPNEKSLESYLQHDDRVDYDNDKIQRLSRSLGFQGGERTGYIRDCYIYVRDEIEYMSVDESLSHRVRASDVLCNKAGNCCGKSILLAALLRCAAIPSGFCFQRLQHSDSSRDNKMVIHTLNAFYNHEVHAWIRIDTRNKRADTVDFRDGKNDLLFYECSPKTGERDYLSVHVHPDCTSVRSHCFKK